MNSDDENKQEMKENQQKFDEYNRFFKVFLVSLCIMFAIIVGVVVTLIISNS